MTDAANPRADDDRDSADDHDSVDGRASADDHELTGARVLTVGADAVADARRRALDLLAAGELDRGVRIAVLAARCMSVADALGAATWLDEALVALGDRDGDAALELQALAARLALRAEHPSADELFATVVELRRERGEVDAVAHALHDRWWSRGGDAELDLLRAAVDEGGAAIDAGGAAIDAGATAGWSDLAAALVANLEGRFDEAAVIAERVVLHAREGDDALLEVDALDNLATARSFLGDVAGARAMLPSTIALADAVRHHDIGLRARLNLAAMRSEELDVAGAEVACRDAMACARTHGLHGWGALAAAACAVVLVDRGDLRGAAEVAAHARAELARGGEGARRHAAFIDLVGLLVVVERGDTSALAQALAAAGESIGASGVDSYALELRVLVARAGWLHTGSLADATALAAVVPVDEPATVARLAGWLARSAATTGDADALVAAGALAARIDRGAAPLADALLAEVDVLVATPGAAGGDGVGAAVAAVDGGVGADGGAGVDRSGHEVARIAALDRRRAAWDLAARPLDAARVVAVTAALHPDATQAMLRSFDAQARLEACDAVGDAAEVAAARSRAVLGDRAGGGAAGPRLSDLAPWNGLSLDARVRLESAAVVRDFDRSAAIADGDDPAGDRVVVLRTGSARLVRTDAEGRRLTVGLVAPGDLAADWCLSGATADGLVVEALESSTAWLVPAEVVRGILGAAPALGVALLRTVALRERRSHQLSADLAFAGVDVRLARLLLQLADAMGRPTLQGTTIIDRPYTHEDLAEMVGSTRKTVTGLLTKLRAAGAVSMRGRRIVVERRDLLGDTTAGGSNSGDHTARSDVDLAG